MTTDAAEQKADSTDCRDSASNHLSVLEVLEQVFRRLRTDPFLGVPFFIAGLVVALADWIRIHDPLPANSLTWMSDTVNVQYFPFPRGTTRTLRELGALVDLQVPYLLGGVALEVIVLLTMGIAGWVTITRCLAVDRSAESFLRYISVFALVGLLPIPEIEISSLPLALFAAVAAFLLVMRVFLFPGFVAAGSSIGTALTRSVRTSRGTRVTLFWLALVLGVASWSLAHVPVAGAFLSTAIVGTVHAVVIAVLIARHRPDATMSNADPQVRGSA